MLGDGDVACFGEEFVKLVFVIGVQGITQGLLRLASFWSTNSTKKQGIFGEYSTSIIEDLG